MYVLPLLSCRKVALLSPCPHHNSHPMPVFVVVVFFSLLFMSDVRLVISNASVAGRRCRRRVSHSMPFVVCFPFSSEIYLAELSCRISAVIAAPLTNKHNGRLIVESEMLLSYYLACDKLASLRSFLSIYVE